MASKAQESSDTLQPARCLPQFKSIGKKPWKTFEGDELPEEIFANKGYLSHYFQGKPKLRLELVRTKKGGSGYYSCGRCTRSDL